MGSSVPVPCFSSLTRQIGLAVNTGRNGLDRDGSVLLDAQHPPGSGCAVAAIIAIISADGDCGLGITVPTSPTAAVWPKLVQAFSWCLTKDVISASFPGMHATCTGMFFDVSI